MKPVNNASAASKNVFQPLTTAQLTWQGNTPISQAFDDVYFSTENGTAETDYVFIEHNHLIQRWQQGSAEQAFVIAEIGFGSGLNFMRTAQHWLNHWANPNTPSQPNAPLHFISFEKYPFHHQDLTRLWNHCAQHMQGFYADLPHVKQGLLEQLIAEFLEKYPPATPGFHRIGLQHNRILLTLCLGDANALLPLLEAKVDAWFLDGFAPAKNPELWQASLFSQLAAHSYRSNTGSATTFATFSAASKVSTALRQVGFKVDKVKGYGKKRHMLRGELHSSEAAPKQLSHLQKPWFYPSYQLPIYSHRKEISDTNKEQKTRKAIVVGGGLAGSASANALAQRGWQVTLLEREAQLAAAASGNPLGVLFTKLSPHNNAQNRFYQLSYLHALEHVRTQLGERGIQQGQWSPCGVLQLAHHAEAQRFHQAIVRCGLWPKAIAYPLDAVAASAVAGIPCREGLFFPKAGWVQPSALVTARCQHPNITVRQYFAVRYLKSNAQGWQVISASGQVEEATVVVIANAHEASQFAQTKDWPLRPIRGQLSFFPENYYSRQLKTILCYDGYIAPSTQGQHCVGATFYPKDQGTDIRLQDHHSNLTQLIDACPNLGHSFSKAHSGRAALRCQAPDYLPLVGPVPDREFFLQHYAPLRTGFLRQPFAIARHLPGLYVNLAHGSRGLTTTALSAEILASYINAEPQPVDQSVLHALHPARFLIRDLKRRKT